MIPLERRHRSKAVFEVRALTSGSLRLADEPGVTRSKAIKQVYRIASAAPHILNAGVRNAPVASPTRATFLQHGGEAQRPATGATLLPQPALSLHARGTSPTACWARCPPSDRYVFQHRASMCPSRDDQAARIVRPRRRYTRLTRLPRARSCIPSATLKMEIAQAYVTRVDQARAKVR